MRQIKILSSVAALAALPIAANAEGLERFNVDLAFCLEKETQQT